MPSDADPLAGFPLRDSGTDLIDDSDHFMSRNAWVLDPRKQSFFDDRIAVTNTTRLNLNADPPSLWLRNFTFD